MYHDPLSVLSTQGGMAAEDAASSPSEVSASWEEVHANEWWKTNAKVECTGR